MTRNPRENTDSLSRWSPECVESNSYDYNSYIGNTNETIREDGKETQVDCERQLLEGSEETYPKLYIKDEPSDDEFIDVVNYFDSDSSRSTAGDDGHALDQECCQEILLSGSDSGHLEETGVFNTQRNIRDPVQEVVQPFSVIVQDVQPVSVIVQDTRREDIKVLKPAEINKDFEKQISKRPQEQISRDFEKPEENVDFEKRKQQILQMNMEFEKQINQRLTENVEFEKQRNLVTQMNMDFEKQMHTRLQENMVLEKQRNTRPQEQIMLDLEKQINRRPQENMDFEKQRNQRLPEHMDFDKQMNHRLQENMDFEKQRNQRFPEHMGFDKQMNHRLQENMDFVKHTNQRSQEDQTKYQLLKQHLTSDPLDKDIVMSRNLNNQIEKQLQSSTLNKARHTSVIQAPQHHQHINTNTTTDNSIMFASCCDFDKEYQPYVIHAELSGGNDETTRGTVENMTLRYRVLVFLWILLGERRLFQVGYPTAPIHVVLWRVVHTCCAVTGVKSAAAVPLPATHDCGTDMLCFRDHVHRFLEICAPTRDHWKQFGWASLTVDAVINKIYKQELLSTLLQHTFFIPVTIRMAMCKLATLEQAQEQAKFGERSSTRWRLVPRGSTPTLNRLATAYRGTPARQPLVVEKKKRGRPVKPNRVPQDTTGKIERVMLWRFVLNLLEEPGNAACIHWLNRDEGIFRILNTDWLARIWGRRHGNPRMTYEKMARAMRTYYRSKVLQPVPRNKNLPRKLVYRFNPALVKRVTAK